MAKIKQSITAIIYDKRGRVLSIGKNQYLKTHPIQAHHAERVGLPHKQYLHAEISAIIRCREMNRAHKIIVTRFDSKGNPVLAKPCPICQSAIDATNIKIVEFTING